MLKYNYNLYCIPNISLMFFTGTNLTGIGAKLLYLGKFENCDILCKFDEYLYQLDR